MGRDIKFQVYDRKLQMMFDVTEISRLNHSEGLVRGQKGDSGGEYYVTSGYLGKKIGIGKNGTAPIVNRFALRDYTGLKDKNGNEIYGGDISKREIFAFGEIRTFIGEIKMFEGCWWIDSGTAAVLLWNEMHELEVIGNIYENPELLEANV